MSSLASARRLLAILDANGVRKNADIQWNDGSCGPVVQVDPKATPWRLLVRTSQGAAARHNGPPRVPHCSVRTP